MVMNFELMYLFSISLLSVGTYRTRKMSLKVVLIPMFTVSFLCGTMPLKFVSLDPVQLRISAVGLTYTLILAALTIANLFGTLYITEEVKKTTPIMPLHDALKNCSIITSQLDTQFLVVQVVNPQILIFMSLGAHWVSIFRLRPKLPLFIDYIISIDRKLPLLRKKLHLQKIYNTLSLRFLILLACSIAVFATYIGLHVCQGGDRMGWLVTLVFHNLVSLTCELQLLIFFLLIKSRFQIINYALSSGSLKTMTQQNAFESRKIIYPKMGSCLCLQQVDMAHDCYLKLCDMWCLLNNIYAVQVLFSTSGCFLKALFNVYFLSSSSASSSDVDLHMINSVMWMVFFFTRFAMLSAAASSTTLEADKTKAIISLMSHYYDEPAIKEELDIFWMNASCRSLRFSTCGLFCLNSGLILKACVTGITYLILLVQFKPQVGIN